MFHPFPSLLCFPSPPKFSKEVHFTFSKVYRTPVRSFGYSGRVEGSAVP